MIFESMTKGLLLATYIIKITKFVMEQYLSANGLLVDFKIGSHL